MSQMKAYGLGQLPSQTVLNPNLSAINLRSKKHLGDTNMAACSLDNE